MTDRPSSDFGGSPTQKALRAIGMHYTLPSPEHVFPEAGQGKVTSAESQDSANLKNEIVGTLGTAGSKDFPVASASGACHDKQTPKGDAKNENEISQRDRKILPKSK